jgi:hypothetical protein
MTGAMRWRFTAVGAVMVASMMGVTFAATAAADTGSIVGSASGQTIAQGNEVFRSVGSYVDASAGGITGRYLATYVQDTTAFSSCDLTGFAAMACAFTPEDNQCNLIHGEITFTSSRGSLALAIGENGLIRHAAAICLDPTNPGSLAIHLALLAFSGPDPVPNRGYGTFFEQVWGYMAGTSQPVGNTYTDSFPSLTVSLG